MSSPHRIKEFSFRLTTYGHSHALFRSSWMMRGPELRWASERAFLCERVTTIAGWLTISPIYIGACWPMTVLSPVL